MSDVATTEEVKTDVATPVAAPKKKAAKKAAPKKAAVKKATKGKKAAVKKGAAAPRAKKEGLRKPQVRVLQALAKSKKPNGEMSRVEIAEVANVDGAMLNSYIGSSDDAIRAANDKKYMPSLLTLGYVKDFDPAEGGGMLYAITASGRKALEKALTAE